MSVNRFILLLSLIVSCTTYDSALIYHKIFSPGSNPLLRTDGYYTPKEEYELTGKVKPVFFYLDGSMYQLEIPVSPNELSGTLKTELNKGSWGNYKVTNDQITAERFSYIVSDDNYRRIILKGVISEKSINWYYRQYGNVQMDSIRYESVFIPWKEKPDSMLNWTRSLKKYNR